MAGRTVMVPLRPDSDGDPTHRPPASSTYTLVDPPSLYLERLGTQWMEARGEAVPGVTYVLEALPAGYALYQRPRKDSKIQDKYLFGHPEHKTFDSPNRFFPHFQYLMDNGGSSLGCPCTMCNSKGGVLPSKNGATSSHFGRSSRGSVSRKNSTKGSTTPTPKPATSQYAPAPAPTVVQQKGQRKRIGTGMDASRIDEEGTPDVYRNLIDKLKKYGSLDETIREPMSMDWRAEQQLLPAVLARLQRDPQWVPRTGEIVLFVRDMPEKEEIPLWEAGVVGQPPAEEATLEDAMQGEDTRLSVNYSGVRVEPLPNPNDPDKTLSKRYKYVPIRYTRPFILWRELLGSESQDWHPTIKNALTVMSTFSFLGKHRFHGVWPEAQIRCHGIYLGSEMLAVGDTVRLLPKTGETICADVLVIKSIRIKLLNLDKASSNDYDDCRPYNSEAWIFGAAYTTDASRSSKEWLSAERTAPVKAANNGYPDLYPLHPATKELAVPFWRVLGRLYEHQAMASWLQDDEASLDVGREGLLAARSFAQKHDKRIAQAFGMTWYWSDTRAEALDLHTVNGLEVSRYDAERDPGAWRKSIKIMEGGSAMNAGAKVAAAGHGGLGGLHGSRGFMAPQTSTTSASLPAHGQNALGSGMSSSGSSRAGQKRGQPEGESGGNGDLEQEIRQHTRIVDEVPGMSQKKKPRVVVMIY